MRRPLPFLAILAAGLLLAVAVWSFLFRGEPERAKPATEVAEVPISGAPPEPAPPPEEAARALPISGRVLDSLLEPVPGLLISLGAEETESTAAGVFSFPEAVRPRSGQLRLGPGKSSGPAGGSAAVTWDDVLTGDLGPPVSGGDLAAEPLDLPARLERIRWTITLNAPPPRGEGLEGYRGGEWLLLEEALAEEWGTSARVRLRGRSRLPDAGCIASSLYFERFRTASSFRDVSLKDGHFEGVVYWPRGQNLYSAPYEALASFNQVLQRPEFVATMAAHPEVPWDTLQETVARKKIFIGDPVEARQEDALVKAYYRQALAEFRALELGLRLRCQELRLLAKDWDPALLQARRSAREGWFHEEYVSEEGKFLEERWRRFLDVEWRPKVKELLERHEARGQEKYQEAGEQLYRGLSALRGLSYVYSGFMIYPLFGLPRHPHDFYPDEDELEDRGRLERIIEGSLSTLERYAHLVD